MSFKFNFDFEEDDDVSVPKPEIGSGSSRRASVRQSQCQDDTGGIGDQRCYTVTLDELLDTLPPCISYSPLSLPSLSRPILRRDLHDARFQLASTSTGIPSDKRTAISLGDQKDQGDGGESYVSAGAGTDLIPGLYEGGLKTWEGGVDLVDVLSGIEDLGGWVRGRGVMEVGCGTALPSAYILSQLLAPIPPDLPSSIPSISPTSTISTPDSRKSSTTPTTLLLQDYNLPVLTLVTLPNLLLSALPYLPAEVLNPPDSAGDIESVLPDLTVPGELDITPQVKESFTALLKERRVELQFKYGAWRGLAEEIGKGDWGLVLSAETIYAKESVDDFTAVLRATTAGSYPPKEKKEKDQRSGMDEGQNAEVEVGLEEDLAGMQVKDDWDKRPLREGGTVILIAAKVLYFGVGGGLQDFLDIIRKQGGWWSLVKEWTSGVGRKVVRIGWS